MKKLIAFDLDGTLAPSKSPVPQAIIDGLSELLQHYEVCVISGGQYGQFQKQLLSAPKLTEVDGLEKLHLMPCCGTQYYKFSEASSGWDCMYVESLTDDEKKRTTDALNQALDELGCREAETYGNVIEDRDSQITMSALGQDIVDELGEEGLRRKESWDPDSTKKNAIRDFVAEKIPDLEVRVGGVSSVDVTKPGIDKAYGMTKMMEELAIEKQNILFIGDRLQPGGNDYPVLEMGIDSIEISDWKETALAIQILCKVAK